MKRVTTVQAWEGHTDCMNCAIRGSALFNGLTEQDFGYIHEPIEHISLKPGEVIYKVGDTANHVFTIRSGLVKLVQYLPDGGQRIVRLMGSTDVIGLEGVVDSQYEHEAVVLRTTEMCRYPAEAVKLFSQTNPVFHKDLLARWQKALTDADTWLTLLSTGSAKKRMANLLLRLDIDKQGKCHLLSREDIGSILSITVETASRTISEFKRTELIKEIRPNHFSLNVEGLQAIVSS